MSHGWRKYFITSMWLVFINASSATTILGYVEKVKLLPNDQFMKAKLDTGAASSSVYAMNIQIYRKSKKKWVSFDVPINQSVVHFDKRLKKHVYIKARSGERAKHFLSFQRPVVDMSVKVGNAVEKIEVNLANRAQFLYPVLLGRKALIKFKVAVDPSKTFVSSLEDKDEKK